MEVILFLESSGPRQLVFLRGWGDFRAFGHLEIRYHLVIVVGTKEYWDEGQPDNAGGVHCEPNIPG